VSLNPDVVMAPDYIELLVAALEARPTFGMAGGKLLLSPGLVDGAGLFINRRRQQILRGHGEADSAQYERAEEVFGIDGAAPLYRRAMLEDIQEQGQYFDEDFVTYKEDIDLAWRARLLGWSAWYEPTAVAVHERTFRPGRRDRASALTRRYSVCNRYLMLLKNETRAGWRRDWLAILAYDAAILAYLCLREPQSLLALGDLYRLWPNARRKHRELMQRQRVSPEAMLDWFRRAPKPQT
jgi:GT2 family glycosyltransferase